MGWVTRYNPEAQAWLQFLHPERCLWACLWGHMIPRRLVLLDGAGWRGVVALPWHLSYSTCSSNTQSELVRTPDWVLLEQFQAAVRPENWKYFFRNYFRPISPILGARNCSSNTQSEVVRTPDWVLLEEVEYENSLPDPSKPLIRPYERLWSYQDALRVTCYTLHYNPKPFISSNCQTRSHSHLVTNYSLYIPVMVTFWTRSNR